MSSNPDLLKTIFGRLTLESIPYHEPIIVATFAGVAIGGVALLALLTYFRLWGYLWREWLTSIDHKKIGIMYVILALIMLLRGFADALMMRGQQAMAFNGNEGYLNSHHYDQVFTAHGVITRCSSASSRAPAGSPIRRCRAWTTAPASASITTYGACRSRAWGRHYRAST